MKLEEMPEKGKKDSEATEDKSKGKINHLHIQVLDDGTYHLHSNTDKDASHTSSHPNVQDLLETVHDHLTSPHLPKLGTGQRFSNLKGELAQEPGVKSPGALAAYIGRKKFGNTPFNALSHHESY